MAETKTMEEVSDTLARTEKMLDVLLQRDKSKNGWVRHIGTFITLGTLAVGGVGAWFANQASVTELLANNDRLEGKVFRLENTTHDIELRMVQESSDLRSLKESTHEIKQDVKAIKERIFSVR